MHQPTAGQHLPPNKGDPAGTVSIRAHNQAAKYRTLAAAAASETPYVPGHGMQHIGSIAVYIRELQQELPC